MPSSVLAHTTATSAIPPLVIHILVPSMIQSEPSRRARVFIEPGSEPASASVRPKHPIVSPAAIGGSHRCFCSSDAERPDRIHRQRSLDRHEAAHARVAGFELGARQAVADGVRTGAAVSLEMHAEQAERTHLLGELLRECAGLEPFGDIGKDLVTNELTHGVANEALLVGQETVDLEEVVRGLAPGANAGTHASSLPVGIARLGAITPPQRALRERDHEAVLRRTRG